MISAHIISRLLTASQRGAKASVDSHLEPRFTSVTCSECGGDYGPGDHGFSHCDSHKGVPSCDGVDAAVHAAKINDPHRQRAADKTMLREIELRAATGSTA